MFSMNGDFNDTIKWLKKITSRRPALDRYASAGVKALQASTPKDTGATSSKWKYEIVESKGSTEIRFNNSNINNGVNIAIILQYGHGTGTGGYVAGRDYINPALAPVFDRMAKELWKEVTS